MDHFRIAFSGQRRRKPPHGSRKRRMCHKQIKMPVPQNFSHTKNRGKVFC